MEGLFVVGFITVVFLGGFFFMAINQGDNKS
jgi:hypothetical protein